MGMQLIDDLPGNVVGVRVTGEVDDQDDEHVLEPAIDDRLNRCDRIRLLSIPGPKFTDRRPDSSDPASAGSSNLDSRRPR